MTVKGETTNIAANVAIVAVKLREGKTKQQILAETGWCRQTLAKYIKAHLADELKAITQEELQLHLRIELERCDDLEDRIEAGTMTDAKRIQLLLSVVKHRCELLGLFPKETIVLTANKPMQRPIINIILQDGDAEYERLSDDDPRRPDMSTSEGRFVLVPKRLPPAPIADAEVVDERVDHPDDD
jgi:hypothetical protein